MPGLFSTRLSLFDPPLTGIGVVCGSGLRLRVLPKARPPGCLGHCLSPVGAARLVAQGIGAGDREQPYAIQPNSRALSLAAHQARLRNSDKLMEDRGSSSIGIFRASNCAEFAGL